MIHRRDAQNAEGRTTSSPPCDTGFQPVRDTVRPRACLVQNIFLSVPSRLRVSVPLWLHLHFLRVLCDGISAVNNPSTKSQTPRPGATNRPPAPPHSSV